MIQDSERGRLRYETERATELDSMITGRRYDNPRIVSLPVEAFRPPAFVRKTAPNMYAELNSLLREVWELNERCVGERLLEAEACLVFADLRRPLAKRIQKWCETYLLRRVQRDNPRDRSDALLTCDRLEDECRQIFLAGCESSVTIASLILAECVAYTQWFLFDRFSKQHIADRIDRLSKSKEGCRTLLKHQAAMQHLISLAIDLDALLAEIAQTIDPAWLMRRSADTVDELRGRIKYLVDDIQQMRPFLVRNFRCEKTITKLSDHLYVTFDWAFGMAIGIVCNATTPDELWQLAAQRRSISPIVHVDHDGLLSDSRVPWRTTVDIGVAGNTTALHVNLYLLELLHGKLFSFYDQIDFEAIRRRVQQANKAELDDEELGVTCQDLVEAEIIDEPVDPVGAKPRLRIAPLRLQRLLIVLQENLGCEVSQGKGSEITVYRPGGKIYVLGRHKADYAVPVPIVKALLSRVGIQAQEWIAVCQRSNRSGQRPR